MLKLVFLYLCVIGKVNMVLICHYSKLAYLGILQCMPFVNPENIHEINHMYMYIPPQQLWLHTECQYVVGDLDMKKWQGRII